VDWSKGSPDELAALLQAAAQAAARRGWSSELITSRGVKARAGGAGDAGPRPALLAGYAPPAFPCPPQVWPNGFPETFLVDHWRCRFRPIAKDALTVDYASILRLMTSLHARGLDVIKAGGGCPAL